MTRQTADVSGTHAAASVLVAPPGIEHTVVRVGQFMIVLDTTIVNIAYHPTRECHRGRLLPRPPAFLSPALPAAGCSVTAAASSPTSAPVSRNRRAAG
jgi:hypothetical protein